MFSEQETKENNIQNIFNFNKNLNEDYSNIEIIAYEFIISLSKTDNALENLITYYYKDGNLFGVFNPLKIILKFPNIINKAKDSTVKLLLNYIYEISPRLQSKNNLINKKILVQLLGLIVTFISKKREITNKGDYENTKSKIISDLENATFSVAFRLYKILFFSNSLNDKNENDNFEMLKKLIVYIREILDSSNNFQMMIPLVDQKSVDSIRNIHIHIQLLRIYVFNIKIDTIYKNIELYFRIYKIMNDNNVNYRIFNDFAFVFRLLNDDKLLIQLNNKEKPNEICFLVHKLAMLDNIEPLIKEMSKRFTNYDTKDLFVGLNKNNDQNGNSFEINIIKKVNTYLTTNKLYNDRNQNIYENRISQNNTNIPTTTNTTVNEAQQQQQQQAQQAFQFQQQQIRSSQPGNQFLQQISNDKWLETFHINGFKYFIFIRKLVEDFYTNNINIPIEDNNLKEKLEIKLKSSQEKLDMIHSFTYKFFENFYCFTLFFLREYKYQFEYYCKKGYLNYPNINKEIREYFLTSHNFYFNLRDFDDLKKIKSEQLDCILHDKDKEKEKEKNKLLTTMNNILIVYPDIILSGILFFFQCEEIVEKYYQNLIDLFYNTYRIFHDKFYEPLLEDLLNKIMFNKFFKDKIEEKNKFMLKIIKCIEFLNVYKTNRINENILTIFVNYLKSNLKEPNYNKSDPNIYQSLHIILYNSPKLELQNRKNIFELIKAYIGDKLIDSLKWIFTYDENEDDNTYSLIYLYLESIPLSIELLLSHFQEGEPMIVNSNNFSKYKALKISNKNEDDMEIENNKNDEKYDKNSFIKNMVDNCNLITKEKKYDELLDLIRANILSDSNSCNKIFVFVFTQIWKILNMNERETLTIYINELLSKYLEKPKEKDNHMINLLFESFSQCSPLIYIKPIIIQS